MPDRPTVLQFSSLAPPSRFGGAERVADWLSAGLQREGATVHNAGLRPRSTGRSATAGYPIDNIYWPFDGVRRGPLRRALWHAIDARLLASRRRVEAIFSDVRPSVVVTHNLRGWGFAPWVVAADTGVHLVHIVHDYGLICNSSTLWRGRVCEQICASCALRRRALIRHWPGGSLVGVSAAVLTEHVTRGVDFFTDGVVAHPTGAAHVMTSTGPAESAQRTFGDGTPAVLGYLGRIDDAKGLGLLLAAAEENKQQVVVAGAGDDRQLDRYAGSRSQDIEWLGWTDPARLFGRVDVLVVPSIWLEPFGLIVVEAAAAGVPVLIADRPGLLEAARSSGARYRSFRANDLAALRRALMLPLGNYQLAPPSGDRDLLEFVQRVVVEKAECS